jgi:hypothetical protein
MGENCITDHMLGNIIKAMESIVYLLWGLDIRHVPLVLVMGAQREAAVDDKVCSGNER